MSIMAGPLIIVVSLWQFGLLYRDAEHNEKPKAILFSVFVIAGSWLAEWAGVETGLLFGEYDYKGVLLPHIIDVPAAIGFAWLGVLLASLGLLSRINLFRRMPIFLKSIAVGAAMTLFDYFMEPAAVKLNYWTWEGGIIPLRNYLAWFIMGAFFAFIGFKSGILNKKPDTFNYHSYLAQMIYFLLVKLA